jgi:hypothetical protein
MLLLLDHHLPVGVGHNRLLFLLDHLKLVDVNF